MTPQLVSESIEHYNRPREPYQDDLRVGYHYERLMNITPKWVLVGVIMGMVISLLMLTIWVNISVFEKQRKY